MANKTPWAERTGSARRRTLGGFGLLYGAVTVVAFAFSWIPIAVVFAAGTLGLGIAWFTTTPSDEPPKAPRAKPDWMLAMDDPNAPDLSRPEYRTEPRRSADAPPPGSTPHAPSPFAPPEGAGDVSPEVPPSPEA